jgi:hypothetical protein
MKPQYRLFGWSVALTSFFCVAPALAVTPIVAFNSFGPGNTYNTAIVWGVTGASTSGGYRGQAEFFVPAVSGDLSSITLPTFRQSGSGRSNFFVAEDNGSTPGTILESFLNTANNSNGLLTLNSVAQPLLTAGLKYWLCDEPADATTVNGWFEGQSYAPGFAFERSQWGWSFVAPPSVPPSGVFSVSVIPVPEPAAVLLIPVAALFVCRLNTPRRAG